jgi:hypothetical protein
MATGLLTRGSTQFGLFVILFILWVVFSSLAPGFLSRFNLNSVGRSVAIDIVVGFAQMVVLATGGMNLSVGAIGVCSVMTLGYLLQMLGLRQRRHGDHGAGGQRRDKDRGPHADARSPPPQRLRQLREVGEDVHTRRPDPDDEARLVEPDQSPVDVVERQEGDAGPEEHDRRKHENRRDEDA